MDYPQDIHINFLSQFTTWIRRKLYYVIGGLGLLMILIAMMLNYIKRPPEVAETVFTESKVNKVIKIDIEGAVERPGIYDVTNDSRIQDVLITAGGMTAKANRNYVSKNINLAQKVYDGQKIFIPEEETSLGDQGNLSNLININTAAEAQLDSLPGIGPTTAKKIIAGRPYQNISQLIEQHIVSQAVYLKIKDLISL